MDKTLPAKKKEKEFSSRLDRLIERVDKRKKTFTLFLLSLFFLLSILCECVRYRRFNWIRQAFHVASRWKKRKKNHLQNSKVTATLMKYNNIWKECKRRDGEIERGDKCDNGGDGGGVGGRTLELRQTTTKTTSNWSKALEVFEEIKNGNGNWQDIVRAPNKNA